MHANRKSTSGVRRYPTTRMSPLESFLLRMEDREAASILHHFETADLFVIGKLNSRLRSWLDWYCRSAWNMPKFAALYVKHPLALLSMMDEKTALIYGEAVFRFFLQCPSRDCPLDICTTLARFYQLQRFLQTQGYDLVTRYPRVSPTRRAWMQVSMNERVGNIIYQAGATQDSWSSSADQSWSSEEHLGYKFKFTRPSSSGGPRTINLHLIRCEPYRHVLAASLYRVLIETTPTATLTCFMSGDRCVAPFANSAFRRKLAFTLRNRRLFTKDLHETTQVIEGDGRRLRFDIAAGRPLAYRAYQDAEIGSRFWGDNSCWVISRLREDPLGPKSAYKGPSFEVLDWRMLHDEEGTYLVIVQDIPMRCEYPPWSMLESGIKHASEGTYSRISDEYFRPSPLLISGQCLPRGLIRELEERRYKGGRHELSWILRAMQTIYWQSVPKFVEHPPGHALLPGAVKASA
ncbi:hypothetical protein DFP72DRAFT_861615 [Ephemerocybe angulata]|uniref:Uncharacterized protein n=1 Tax=Ephemerocybe angulata TaxID=980116 RepID=A0A8H6LUM2_9AGAR|nr:hypothetical protein DFP72DRAFT_861615 [Tulosesus angulatus]